MEKKTLSNSDVLPIAHSIIWAGSFVAAAIVWSGASKQHWFIAVILGAALVSSVSLHYYYQKQR
jgi:CHASE2 domain-containing sensor protein